MKTQIYLDNSATTAVCEAARQAACQAMEFNYYNPAALYKPAVALEKQIEAVRQDMAGGMGATAAELTFVSGGTEANHIAILGLSALARNKKYRFVCGPMEHPAVYRCFEVLAERGHEVVTLHCDPEGKIDAAELESVVNADTALVSIMHVNNELGAVADLAALQAAIAKANPNTVFHSDGVQAFAHLLPSHLPVDAYSLSGHKCHAPKGSGALLLRKGRARAAGPPGGGQEGGVRSGTLNVPGILGLGAAYACWKEQAGEQLAQMKACKQRLATALLSLPDVLLNGPAVESGAPHILNLSFMGVRGEVLLHALEEKGILVSTGSACSSRRAGQNRALAAIGVEGERAGAAVRFSLGRFNTLAEMDRVAEEIGQLLPLLRRFQPR